MSNRSAIIKFGDLPTYRYSIDSYDSTKLGLGPGDLDKFGTYKIQGLILMGGGTYHSSISVFDVKCNL